MESSSPTPASADPTTAATTSPHGGTSLRIALRGSGIEQVSRLAWCALAIASERLAGRCLDVFTAREDRAARRAARNERAVRRVVTTLGALKGAFAKAGQFAAVRHDLLPGPVTAALGSLRDRVPPLPFERIRDTIEAELGAPLEALFCEFETEPLGAASLAQVHRAKLPSGQPVAVKVQYPWLRASLRADLALMRAFLLLWSRRARGMNRKRILDEFAAGLASELDFRHEARVAEEIAANLACDPGVVVPAPIHTHTAQRVLTMTYTPAVPVADSARLAELGVEPRAVLEILGRAYAKQVFADGLFHADPHPGNLFVLDEPGAAQGPRVLFIDFGLCRRLDPVLRREMRQGLYALIQRDVDDFVGGMDRMGMIATGAREGVHRAVAQMFTRIAEEGGALDAGGARILALKDEAKRLLQQTEGIQLPIDLLLYAKTVTYVFALGAEIAPEVDLMKLALPYVLQFLAQKD
jgi:predicted unusual protein kinase regulating ubiquinone biosynthesis (AarF/ABC1/UbiB family)